VQAKVLALKKMFSTRALRYMMPFLPAQLDEIRDVFGDDPTVNTLCERVADLLRQVPRLPRG